ncbi:hypothetical protein VNO77_18920 [Canavalia gladiata]|uniref:Uncharacterized protein n=1 Tax=Canavalia gladiata TaxID=3824 RepID=A0AAN9QK24_CANGL
MPIHGPTHSSSTSSPNFITCHLQNGLNEWCYLKFQLRDRSMNPIPQVLPISSMPSNADISTFIKESLSLLNPIPGSITNGNLTQLRPRISMRGRNRRRRKITNGSITPPHQNPLLQISHQRTPPIDRLSWVHLNHCILVNMTASSLYHNLVLPL